MKTWTALVLTLLALALPAAAQAVYPGVVRVDGERQYEVPMLLDRGDTPYLCTDDLQRVFHCRIEDDRQGIEIQVDGKPVFDLVRYQGRTWVGADTAAEVLGYEARVYRETGRWVDFWKLEAAGRIQPGQIHLSVDWRRKEDVNAADEQRWQVRVLVQNASRKPAVIDVRHLALVDAEGVRYGCQGSHSHPVPPGDKLLLPRVFFLVPAGARLREIVLMDGRGNVVASAPW